MSEQMDNVRDEARQILSKFEDQFTKTVEVSAQKSDSADWEITIHKTTGQDYRFTWVSQSNKGQRQEQLRKFLLHAASDNLPSGSYDGRDYLSD